MDLVFFNSHVGIPSFVVLMALLWNSANKFPLGPLALPSISIITSVIYFYIIPALSSENGQLLFLNVCITSLDWLHVSLILYTAGMIAACSVYRRNLITDVATLRKNDRNIDNRSVFALMAIAGAGIIALAIVGRLNIIRDENYEIVNDYTGLAFLNMSFTLMIPLVVVYAIKSDFKIKSLILIAVTLYIFSIAGFRFRIVILTASIVASYVIVRGIKLKVYHAIIGIPLAFAAVNAFGKARTYGEGLDLSALSEMTWSDLITSFSGERGVIFALSSVIDNPRSELIYTTPWMVAISRMVPTFLWPDKPSPEYLYYVTEGFDTIYRRTAGIAPPQQAEILLQFGWIGLPIVTFIYFSFACKLIGWFGRLGREGRVAGYAMVPVFFGFYMQQRGYFFQMALEGIFMFGPLFIIYMQPRASARKSVPLVREDYIKAEGFKY